jgi:hypothetical protein
MDSPYQAQIFNKHLFTISFPEHKCIYPYGEMSMLLAIAMLYTCSQIALTDGLTTKSVVNKSG